MEGDSKLLEGRTYTRGGNSKVAHLLKSENKLFQSRSVQTFQLFGHKKTKLPPPPWPSGLFKRMIKNIPYLHTRILELSSLDSSIKKRLAHI